MDKGILSVDLLKKGGTYGVAHSSWSRGGDIN
jgi:hypothetical protein